MWGKTMTNVIEKIKSIVDEQLFNNIHNFIASVKYSKSENTILAYLYDLSAILYIFYETSSTVVTWDQISSMTIQSFRSGCATLRKNGIGPASQQRIIATWKVFLKYYNVEALNKLRGPKIPKRHPRPVLEDAINAIMNMERKTWLDWRNQALWLLMYASGMRISEALSLRISDLAPTVRIVGKGGKHRLVTIIPKALDVIQQYLLYRPNYGDILFVGSKGDRLSQQTAAHVFRKWRESNNIEQSITLHSLRHGFATGLLRNGCPVHGVQKMLGHSRLTTTMQYIAITETQLQTSFQKHMLLD